MSFQSNDVGTSNLERSDEQISQILANCQPLATRLISEGPNLPLESLTESDRQAITDFEEINNLDLTSERLERLTRQAGLQPDVLVMMERLHARLEVESNPKAEMRQETAHSEGNQL